jgi:hypothetical protein
VLDTIVSAYQKFNPVEKSGRDWVVKNAIETRRILRRAQELYELELTRERLKERNNLTPDEHLALIEAEQGLTKAYNNDSAEARELMEELCSYFK